MHQNGWTKDGSKPMIPQDDDLLLDAPGAAEAKQPPKLDPREFREHLGCFATGITVVTALGARGSSCSDVLKWNPGLLAQCGQVEVDPFAGHQPLRERHVVVRDAPCAWR